MNNKSSRKDLEVFKQLSILWNTFKYYILDEYVQDKYPGLRIARMDLQNSSIKTHDSEFRKFSIMQLFIKYGYTSLSDYGKFTISYVIYISRKSHLPKVVLSFLEKMVKIILYMIWLTNMWE